MWSEEPSDDRKRRHPDCRKHQGRPHPRRRADASLPAAPPRRPSLLSAGIARERNRGACSPRPTVGDRTYKPERHHQGNVFVPGRHPWTFVVTRNTAARDAQRKAASWYAADTYGNIRLTSPEGSVHAENRGNSTNNQVLRAHARALGVRLMPLRSYRTFVKRLIMSRSQHRRPCALRNPVTGKAHFG